MFLRITAALMLLLLPFYGEGSLIPTDRYKQKDAETDTEVLKSILSRHPDDLKTLKRLIDLTFTLEYFDQTEEYSSRYLAVKKNSDAAYLKILAAASLGKIKTAADQLTEFIIEYKDELSSHDITLLKYRENLYRQSTVTRGYPVNSGKTSWGTDSMLKASIPRESLFTVYNSVEDKHTVSKIIDDAAVTVNDLPDYLSGFRPESINFISLSDDGREVLISSDSGDSSSIYIRRYLPDEKKWSSWESPGMLNPGKWNHYPNFISNNTVIFSSSDGSDYDLYISQRGDDGEWSRPEKPAGVNTPLDEISAWVHPDGETLYFSSNGYEGMGGFDLYGARLIHRDGSFEVSGIKNISSANTFRNEKYPLFVSPSGNEAYFNFREGNNFTVYKLNGLTHKPVPVFFYTADVIDDSTGNPVNGASAEYKPYGAGYAINRKVYSDGFTGTVLRRDIKYSLSVSADGYEQFSKTVSYAVNTDISNEQIRLKKKTVKPVIPGYITLITSIKLIDCEESKAAPIHEALVNGIGFQTGSADKGKNISSFTICGNTRCALIDGKAVNADFVVFGTLVKTRQSAMKTLGKTGEDQYIAQRVTGTAYVLELKLLDTASGKVVLSYKKSAANPDSLKNIVYEFIKRTESFYQRSK